jgi:hypothetical protein
MSFAWLRRFRIFRPRCQFDKGAICNCLTYYEPLRVVDPKVDHLGEIGVRGVWSGNELRVSPESLEEMRGRRL